MLNTDEYIDSIEDVFDFDDEDGNQTDVDETDDPPEDDAAETDPDEEDTEDPADEPQDEPDAADNPENDNEDKAEEDGAEGDDKGDDKGDSDASEQKFTIKVNKQDMELTLAQMTEYAQKGADYDRVKGQLETSRQNEQALQAKLDEQQEAMDILNMIAEQTKTPLADLLEQLHINAVKKEGQTDAEVKAQIRADKLERQLKAKNDQQTQQKAAEDEAVSRMQREMADFRKQFPDVQLTEDLANKLGPDIQAGMSVTEAYLKQENARKDAEIAQLKEEQTRKQAAAEQNKKNRAKSPGSMRDSGGGRTKDLADIFEDVLFG